MGLKWVPGSTKRLLKKCKNQTYNGIEILLITVFI